MGQGRPQNRTTRTSREFHSHWICCLGDCDKPGLVACLFSTLCPYAALGWNLKRATGKTWLGWMAGALYCALFWAWFGMVKAHLECRERHCIEQYPFTECREDLCSDSMGYKIARLVTLLIWLLGIISRQQIRQTLKMDSLSDDIATVCCSDICSWLACHCGLCQETRTMMINRVEDGIWRGPAVMVKSPAGDRNALPQAVEQFV